MCYAESFCINRKLCVMVCLYVGVCSFMDEVNIYTGGFVCFMYLRNAYRTATLCAVLVAAEHYIC